MVFLLLSIFTKVLLYNCFDFRILDISKGILKQCEAGFRLFDESYVMQDVEERKHASRLIRYVVFAFRKPIMYGSTNLKQT